MKSEHRHELAENDLSKLIGRWMEAFDEHANKILIAIVIAALIAAGFIYWTRTSRFQQESGWTELAASSSPEQFQAVADTFADSMVGDFALLRAANGFLQEGIRRSLSDRPASNDRLEQAREAFESLIEKRTHPAIREPALLGLAMTLEAQSSGDTEPAIAAYQQLLDEFPQTRFRQWAVKRMDALKTGSAQEFYAWFHEQNPQPPDLPLPQDQGRSSSDSLDDILNFNSGSGSSPPGSPFDDLTVPLSEDGKSSPSPTGEGNPFEGESADEKATDSAAEPGPGSEGAVPAEGEADSGSASEDPADSKPSQTEAPASDPSE